jgi:hypothetical protein
MLHAWHLLCGRVDSCRQKYRTAGQQHDHLSSPLPKGVTTGSDTLAATADGLMLCAGETFTLMDHLEEPGGGLQEAEQERHQQLQGVQAQQEELT